LERVRVFAAADWTVHMKSKGLKISLLLISISSLVNVDGCSKASDVAAEAPPPASVVPGYDVSAVAVDHPEQFPLATAVAYTTTHEMVVTGTVNPDIARTVPVISLASGRVIAIHARLGDTVKKGQVLLTIRSDDMSGAFSDYRKAIADEILARAQLERTEDLYKHGATSQNDLQIAEDIENKAKVDVETTSEHLRLLGGNLDHPVGTVDIVAPVSGVITDQQVTNAAGVQSLGTSPFTISDLSYVWIVCDVYENDLSDVAVGDTAEIRLNAYPGQVLTGTISNIGTILDPALRTAKVRVEVRNPGRMRVGMFTTATFHGKTDEVHTSVPATAIMRVHDRDWVYVPSSDKKFRRVAVVSGEAMSNNMQEVKSGLQPGQQVVTNALALQNTVEQ
jgi:cobalt-zinc-cadmium efflux system membrane fusion protein